MEPVVVATDAILVVGIRARTTHRIETVPQAAKIPALWRRFVAEDLCSRITNRRTDSLIVAFADYERGDQGAFSVVLGQQVESLDLVPAGLQAIRAPAGKYLRFEGTSLIPAGVVQRWDVIREFFARSHQYERAFNVDFELHPAGEEAAAEIYVSVK